MSSTAPALPGAPYVAYQNGKLYLEQCELDALAQRYGTPLFVYSKAAMLAALAAYQQGFAGRDARVCYALKANSSLAILQLFAQAGCGFDVVSAGELERVLAAGAKAQQVIFSGVGKTRAEMRRALALGIACFNVESEAELAQLNQVALDMGLVAPISLRVNPDVDAQTHPYISTGLKGNKFGIAHQRALAVYRHAATLPGLRIKGIDCHIGSQITQVAPYLDAMERLLDLVAALEAEGIVLSHLDFGGGLGIQYRDETPPAAQNLWQALFARIDARGYGQRTFFVEPGRSLVGNAGLCLTEVLALKPGESKNFCIVDAAMNDLPRPALYQAFHDIVPLVSDSAATGGTPAVVYDVVGPVCESGDWLGRDRALSVREGARLAVLSAGAYSMSMASNYNTRPRAAELLIDGAQATLIREREPLESLWQHERLLAQP